MLYSVPYLAVGGWHDLADAAREGPASFRFKDLCKLVEALGYLLDRQKGSHLIYRHHTRRDLPIINLQRGSGGKAKPYQVRQVLRIIEEFKLEASV